MRIALAFTIIVALAGCNSGPKVFRVKGTVMYQGKPMVKGKICFDPDPRKGNDGPQLTAMITNGQYEAGGNGRGVVGGGYIIRIEGFDGIAGPELPYGKKTVTDYEETRDLPAADQEQNFDIK